MLSNKVCVAALCDATRAGEMLNDISAWLDDISDWLELPTASNFLVP